MAKIEGFRVKNFRTLKDVSLGRFANQLDAAPLTPLTAVIGKNGVGKSTLFDAFGFLADCLKFGVEEACDAAGRGGFDKIRSQGESGPIQFGIYYKEDENLDSITYELFIDIDSNNRPIVAGEMLLQTRIDDSRASLFTFFILFNGFGVTWEGDKGGIEIDLTEELDLSDLAKSLEASEQSKNGKVIRLDDTRKLGIATLGAFKQHPRISALRRFIEGWYLSYFTPNAARKLSLWRPQQHLNIHGDNLGNVVQFMRRDHPERFKSVLKKIAKKIPGIDKIDTTKSEDERLLLRFHDKRFKKPFYAQQMSDGTLKIFAYLLLLEDPTPPPFLCVEEPENGLYHKLLEILAEEFRSHATGGKDTSQVFITTHQPYFVNALDPEEVWILEKGEGGFSTIRRASDNELVKNMVEEGLPLGGLWYSDYLDGGD